MANWQVEKIDLIGSQWFSSILSKASASVWSSSRWASVNLEVSCILGHLSQKHFRVRCSSSTYWTFKINCLFLSVFIHLFDHLIFLRCLEIHSEPPFLRWMWLSGKCIICAFRRQLNNVHSAAYMPKSPGSHSMFEIQV